ncbi:MAG: polysaccharide biosynthesis tyrosine autokinase [Isosphaeraceae bacterium]
MPEPVMIGPAAAPQAPRIIPGLRAGMSSPTATATMSPMSILRALRRRQLLALGVAILLTSISGPAAWFLIPVKFKAQARLQVAAELPKVLFRTVETEAHDDYKRYQNTQQALVMSQLVLNAALQDAKVSAYRMVREQIDPITWLQGSLKVEFVAGSEVMEISLSGADPEELAGIVNAVKKAYMDEVVHVDTNRRKVRHDKLKKLRQNYSESLKERRENLRKLAETVGSDDRQTMAFRAQLAIEHKAAVQKELLDVESQKRRTEARLKSRSRLEQTPGETSARSISETDVEQAIDRDPTVARLMARLADQNDHFDSEMAKLGRISRNPASDPLRMQLRREIEATKRSLASRRKALRPEVIRQLEQQETVVKIARGDETEQDLAMFNELEQSLKAQLETISQGNQSLTVKTLDLQALQDDVAQMEESAVKVGAEVEALNVELEAPDRIRIVEDAVPPRTKDDKRRLSMIGMIILGSFFGGLFGIAFLELQTQKVDSADEVPVELGLAVVGALPVLPSRAHRGGAIARRETEKDRHWQNLLLESVDATRTMLVHAARTGSHRVVMIASAVGGEGTTSLASYLATSLARSGLKTLLVDADLRSPSIHRLYDLPPAPGLSEVLRREVDLADAIGATPIEDLHVLSAGQFDRQTIRVLAQGGLGPVLGQLKERFDFVIVDSSPILPVTDASIIAQHVDAVLFSIFREVSRKTKVLAALQRLQCLGVQVLGAVVTGAPGGLYGKSYYDSSTYYSRLPESAAVTSDSSAR